VGKLRQCCIQGQNPDKDPVILCCFTDRAAGSVSRLSVTVATTDTEFQRFQTVVAWLCLWRDRRYGGRAGQGKLHLMAGGTKQKREAGRGQGLRPLSRLPSGLTSSHQGPHATGSHLLTAPQDQAFNTWPLRTLQIQTIADI
jgi:hypothetical protein